MESFQISLKSQHFRFNSAHFLANPAEPLHGHNYQVKLKLFGENQLVNGMLIDFNEISPILKEICAKLHQKLIIPWKSQDWCINIDEAEKNIDFLDKDSKKLIYRFPMGDCAVLELENASAEEIARFLLGEVEEKLGKTKIKSHKIRKMRLSVYESSWSLASFQKKYY